MLTPQLELGGRESRRLLQLYRKLSKSDRRSLLDYAEFLVQRTQPEETLGAIQAPVAEPRPPKESVVAAIKRLTRVYPMLDRESMLGETSALMAGHLLQGRPAADVIDELESLFERHYQKMSRDIDV